MKRMLCIALLALAAASCTIKEDRLPCPCWLDIDVTLCSRRADDVSLRGWNAEGPLFGDILSVVEWPDGWTVEVPKGLVEYTAYTGLDRCALSGNSLVIPVGSGFDQIWAYRTSLYCEGEKASDRVVLHKQFACVTVKMREKPEGALSARIMGTSAGFSLLDLSPVTGEFDVKVNEVSDGYFVFNLPRQADNWASMEVLCDGVHYRTLDLGEMIERTGYDWTAEDLDDIYIGLDFTKTDIEIRIEPWQKGAVYDSARVSIDLSGEDFADTKSSFTWDDSAIQDIQMVVSEDDGTLYESVYTHSADSLSFRGLIGRHYNVWIAANVGERIKIGDLSDFKAQRSISQSEIASYGVPMYSSGTDGVTVGATTESLTVVLRRMLARVDFNIDRSRLSSPSGLTVKDVRIRNAVSSFTPFSESVKASGTASVSTIDHSSASDLQILRLGGTVSLYAFENMQGTLLPSNSDPWSKVPSSIGSAADLCTWLEVDCSYEHAGRSSDDITYRMYLGDDATTNFDVRRNCIYTVTLIPTEEEIYGERGSWKIESGSWTDRRPVSLAFSQTHKDMYVNGPNAGSLGTWTPGLTVTYADGTSASVAGTLTASDSSVVGVSGMTVTGLSVGSTTLSASYTEYGITVSTTVPATVDVTDPLIGLTLSPSELDITKGTSYSDWTLTAIYPSADVEIVWDKDAYDEGNPTWEITASTTHSEKSGQGGKGGTTTDVADFSVSTRTQGSFNWSTFSYDYTYGISVSASSSAGDDACGTLTATYSDSGVTLSAQCSLNATDATVTGYSYSISSSSMSMEVGEIGVISSYLTTYYNNGTSKRSNASSLWTTSESYRLYNAYAGGALNTGNTASSVRFKAYSSGTAVITAQYTDPAGAEHSATCTVTISDAESEPEYTYEQEEAIVISPEAASLAEDESVQFTATLTTTTYELIDGVRSGESTSDSSDVTSLATWSIDSGAGYVTNGGGGFYSWESGPGTAVIRATYGDASATAELTTGAHGSVVTHEKEYEISLSPESATIGEGGTAQFSATLTTYTYEVVDGVRSGQVQSGTSNVTSSATWSIVSGAQYVSSKGEGAFSWQGGPGTAVVMASYMGVNCTAEITTSEPRSSVITYEQEYSLDLTPEDVTLMEGESVQFTATLTTLTYELSDGVRTGEVQTHQTDVTSSATWSIESGSRYVSNDGGGEFSWLYGLGTATIKATYGEEEATASILVCPGSHGDDVVLERIEVEPDEMTLRYSNGWYGTYEVTAYYSDGTSEDVTSSAIASNPACAIAKNGTVNASAAGTGTVTLSYTDDGVTCTDEMEVTSLDELYCVGLNADISGGESGSAICYVENVTATKESHFSPGTTNYVLGRGEYSYTAGEGLRITQLSDGSLEVYVSVGTCDLTLSYTCPVSGEVTSITITFSRGTGGGVTHDIHD